MNFFAAPLERLIEQFARLPGIGSKTAQRLAFHVISLPDEDAHAFSDAILEAKKTIGFCKHCQNLTDTEICPICANPTRDRTTICVVADPRDVLAFERTREYKGLYHVLHGTISPINGIGPDELRIRELVKRIDGSVKEVIMATNPDAEGEATAMYISRLLAPLGVKVTRLAYGIPVGGHLEFADGVTIIRSLAGRTPM